MNKLTNYMNTKTLGNETLLAQDQQHEQTGHTPGPWRVDFNKYDNQWRVYQVDGPPIINSLFHSGNESEANARLIAAAPELLEAAKALQREGWMPRSARRLFAAILKAEGL